MERLYRATPLELQALGYLPTTGLPHEPGEYYEFEVEHDDQWAAFVVVLPTHTLHKPSQIAMWTAVKSAAHLAELPRFTPRPTTESFYAQ